MDFKFNGIICNYYCNIELIYILKIFKLVPYCFFLIELLYQKKI